MLSFQLVPNQQFLCSDLSVAFSSASAPRCEWRVSSPCLAFESEVRQDGHGKPDTSSFCVCVSELVCENEDRRSLTEGGASGPEPAFKTFLKTAPYREGVTWGNSLYWLLLAATNSQMLLHRRAAEELHVWPLKSCFSSV